MDQSTIDQLRNKSKNAKRGICQKCKAKPSTSRVQILALEKYGDAKAEEKGGPRGQQKFKNIASKAATLCDDCCIVVFGELVDLMEETVAQG